MKWVLVKEYAHWKWHGLMCVTRSLAYIDIHKGNLQNIWLILTITKVLIIIFNMHLVVYHICPCVRFMCCKQQNKSLTWHAYLILILLTKSGNLIVSWLFWSRTFIIIFLPNVVLYLHFRIDILSKYEEVYLGIFLSIDTAILFPLNFYFDNYSLSKKIFFSIMKLVIYFIKSIFVF